MNLQHGKSIVLLLKPHDYGCESYSCPDKLGTICIQFDFARTAFEMFLQATM